MINRIIEFSANNRLVIFAFFSIMLMAAWWSLQEMPLDAIPDLSDTQVIVYSRWDRSPDLIEDQVTYPIVAAMLGAPKVEAVRGFSDFGYSYVYIIFKEGTDIYWARSRTLEYLSSVQASLPSGVKTQLGPDATGLGWVFQYALVDPDGKHSLSDLRSYQDWYLRYYLKSVPGVAEVAPIGGFVRQYQINVDPNRLQAYGISMERLVEAVRNGNNDAGGRLLEYSGAEYMIRGRGYARSVEDLGKISLAMNEGAPVRVKDVAEVVLGPDIRRGVADLDGKGNVVSGIVVMRQGENALRVIDRIKAKLDEIQPGLPEGVRIVTCYDRSELIHASIRNLNSTIMQELAIVCLVILVFLWHPPSSIIPMITIPVAVLLSFIPMRLLGITSNIMSLGGIAIAIGALDDAAIVVVEQTHKKLELWQKEGSKGDYRRVVIDAIKEVGGPSFFALLVIAVSFLPVLTLEAQEGRLFRPLAYTKNLSMIIAAVLAITLDPALRLLFTHARHFQFRPAWLCKTANAILIGRIRSEETHPLSRTLIRIYEPVCDWTLRNKWIVIGGAVALVAITIPVFRGLGREFMPPLDEGDIFYMPSTLPGISVAEAERMLQLQDRIIKQFPEVARVTGKAGRAETSTDPAPLSMMETVILLKPKDQWRRKPTWYSSWSPEWLKPLLRHITPDHISTEELVNELNDALKLPGVSNAWTMPIRARIDMLSTNIRTPVGVKISGSDPQKIEEIATQIEAVLPKVAGTRSAFAERAGRGYFLDIVWNRDELARSGLSIQEGQDVIEKGIGGDNITTTIEGRERYGVSVRFMRELRDDPQKIERLHMRTETGWQVPIRQVADLNFVSGPSMLRNENGMLTGYVYVDVAGRDLGGYVDEAKQLVRQAVKLPPGYAVQWSGQYEAMERVKKRLGFVLPITFFLIILLLYANTRSAAKTLIVLLAVPFSAIGAIWLLYFLGYNMSIGVWVGLIALLGVDAETGVFMLLYLDLAYAEAKAAGKLITLAGLRQAIINGAVKRIRPKFMTVATTFIGLIPILWSIGIGSDVMKRIAAPLVGGILTSFLLELIVYPAVYEVWKWNFDLKRGKPA